MSDILKFFGIHSNKTGIQGGANPGNLDALLAAGVITQAEYDAAKERFAKANRKKK